MKKQNNVEEIIADEVIRSPHKKRKENLPQRKKDRFEEGIKNMDFFLSPQPSPFLSGLFRVKFISISNDNVIFNECYV